MSPVTLTFVNGVFTSVFELRLIAVADTVVVSSTGPALFPAPAPGTRLAVSVPLNCCHPCSTCPYSFPPKLNPSPTRTSFWVSFRSWFSRNSSCPRKYVVRPGPEFWFHPYPTNGVTAFPGSSSRFASNIFRVRSIVCCPGMIPCDSSGFANVGSALYWSVIRYPSVSRYTPVFPMSTRANPAGPAPSSLTSTRNRSTNDTAPLKSFVDSVNDFTRNPARSLIWLRYMSSFPFTCDHRYPTSSSIGSACALATFAIGTVTTIASARRESLETIFLLIGLLLLHQQRRPVRPVNRHVAGGAVLVPGREQVVERRRLRSEGPSRDRRVTLDAHLVHRRPLQPVRVVRPVRLVARLAAPHRSRSVRKRERPLLLRVARHADRLARLRLLDDPAPRVRRVVRLVARRALHPSTPDPVPVRLVPEARRL